MGLRYLLLGLAIGFILDGCAAPAAFTYKYYGLDAVSYDGSLAGPKPVDDLSLKICEPDAQHKSKCVVMLIEEFLRLKGDHLMLEKQLIACQQGVVQR